MPEQQPHPLVTIQLFGNFAAKRSGVPLPGLHLRDGERLLAYLSLRAGEPVSSWELAKWFWPAEAQGTLDGQGDFPSVRQALHSLRQSLGADAGRLTRPSRATVRLDLTGVEVDILTFDRLTQIQTGNTSPGDVLMQADADAVALYRGPLLDGWNESWILGARTRRRQQYEKALRRLAQSGRQAGQLEGAERWIRLLLDSRPADEEVWRDLLRVLGAAGRHAEVREALEQLTRAVAAKGQALEPETTALADELRGGRKSEHVRTILPSIPAAADPPSQQGDLLKAQALTLEVPGGAVPITSRFYIVRQGDGDFHAALARRDSIVLVKGARQVGKTSLLARGLQQAREAGARVVLTDFQKLNTDQLASPDALYLALAASIAQQLGLTSPRLVWDEDFGPNMNMELYLRLHIMPAISEPLVWAMDEVDRLFVCPFGGEVFGLFRSWHNERSLDPSSILCRLTLAIAYATEAHLFITDPNQSPFNVGTRLALSDFTPEQVSELNGRYGSPWSEADLVRFRALVGGQPYLVRLGLDQAAQGIALERIEAEAGSDDSLFSEHLRRLLGAVSRAPEHEAALRGLLGGSGKLSPEAFYHLRAAGVLTGPSSAEARFRCLLYESFFTQRLALS